MDDSRKVGKGVLIAATLIAAAGGVWFGRCSRHVPVEASGSASAWAAASSPPSSSGASSGAWLSPGAASDEKIEPQHFDVADNPSLKAGIALREMGREIFKALNDIEHLDRARMADVFPGRPYNVRFIGSVEQRHVGIVFIDLNRKGKIDERWELGAGEVKRTVPKDRNAGDGEVRYSLAQGRWQLR